MGRRGKSFDMDFRLGGYGGGKERRQEELVIREYVGEPRCRAAVLSRFLEGVGWYCEEGKRSCARCRQPGLHRAEEREEARGEVRGRREEEERSRRRSGGRRRSRARRREGGKSWRGSERRG